MSKNTLYLTAVSFMAALIMGSIAFIFWVTPFLIAEHTERTEVLLRMLGVASLLKYGTVVNVDATSSTISIRVKSQFQGEPESQFLIHVNPSTYIARQELQAGPDGTYITLPAAIAAPLSAIRQGDRTAILFGHRTDNSLTTSYILFGNPL